LLSELTASGRDRRADCLLPGGSRPSVVVGWKLNGECFGQFDRLPEEEFSPARMSNTAKAVMLACPSSNGFS
jgi:hypothetical protein